MSLHGNEFVKCINPTDRQFIYVPLQDMVKHGGIQVHVFIKGARILI